MSVGAAQDICQELRRAADALERNAEVGEAMLERARQPRPLFPPGGDDISKIVAERVETVAKLLESDPHQWSKRPCPTCRPISELLGRSFGCVAEAERYRASQKK